MVIFSTYYVKDNKMSIVKLQPDQEPPVNLTTPETIEEPSKSIFTALVPESRITSLLKYVEGYPWTVKYYGQIVNINNTLENFDPSTPNLTQPYYKINNLILQVNSPLSSSYDQTSGITTISGSAITPYKIVPNVGDIFIAQVDSGEDAIFIVTTVSRKTYRKDTLYDISYNLYSYISNNPQFITTLESRVQQAYFFNKDTNFFNRDHLITPVVKEATDRLKHFLNESQDYYFSTFSQKQTGTILIPGTNEPVYDPQLLDFITSIVDYNRFIDLPFYKFSYGNNKYIEQSSFFDLLLKRNINQIELINKKYIFVSSGDLPNRARFGTIGHSGISYILFPLNPNKNTDIDSYYNIDTNLTSVNIKTPKNYFMPNPPLTVEAINNNNIFTKPLLHELFINDYYVVSENFYNYINDNTLYNNISYIELLIYKFLKKQAIAKEDLVVCTESYINWSALHSLYLLPVLWLLVKSNL